MSKQSNAFGRKSAKPSKLVEPQLDTVAAGGDIALERPAPLSSSPDDRTLNFTLSAKAQSIR